MACVLDSLDQNEPAPVLGDVAISHLKRIQDNIVCNPVLH